MLKTLVLAVSVVLLACPGPAGPEGPQGPQGPRGATGDPGPSGFASGLRCLKTSGGLLFEYELARFTDGDGVSSCAITDSATTYSQTEFLWGGTSDATNGTCILVYDVDASPTFGFWAFSGANRNVTYNDPGSSFHGRVETFSSTQCTVR